MGGYVRLHCDKKTMLTEAIPGRRAQSPECDPRTVWKDTRICAILENETAGKEP